jgi:hypothetical protein
MKMKRRDADTAQFSQTSRADRDQWQGIIVSKQKYPLKFICSTFRFGEIRQSLWSGEESAI